MPLSQSARHSISETNGNNSSEKELSQELMSLSPFQTRKLQNLPRASFQGTIKKEHLFLKSIMEGVKKFVSIHSEQ